jgi:hypothetical protein
MFIRGIKNVIEVLNRRAFVILRGALRPEESPSHPGILQLVKLASE